MDLAAFDEREARVGSTDIGNQDRGHSPFSRLVVDP